VRTLRRMFDSIGWGEILVLVVAGLFVLGPERLPGAAAWLGRTVAQVKSFATGAGDRIREEIGSDLDDLRRPVDELRALRGREPRRQALDALLRDPAGDPAAVRPPSAP